MKSLFKNKTTNYFILVSSLPLLLILILENINGRFWLNDFKVMYSAAEALISGGQVYGKPFGLDTGFYKYSPFTALLFVPYTILPFKVAAVLHYLIVAVCSVSTILFVEELFRNHIFKNQHRRFLPMLFVFVLVVVHLFRELHLGNINMILVFLLVNALRFSLKNLSLLAGVLLACVILAKPYFGILIIPFLVTKKFKEVMLTGISIGVMVLLSILVLGWSLYEEWVQAMLDHSSYLTSSHTLFSLFDRYLGFAIHAKFSMPLLVIIGLVSGLFFWLKSKKEKELFQDGNLIFHFFFLIAIVPNILITDTEHFLFSLPLIGFFVFYLGLKKNLLQTVLFSIPLLFYAINSKDLWGEVGMKFYHDFGFLGIANLLIIAIVTGVFLRLNSQLCQ